MVRLATETGKLLLKFDNKTPPKTISRQIMWANNIAANKLSWQSIIFKRQCVRSDQLFNLTDFLLVETPKK